MRPISRSPFTPPEARPSTVHPRNRSRLATLLGALLVTLAAAAPGAARAQVPLDLPSPGDQLYEVELSDGTDFVARIVENEGERIVFETTAGTRIETTRRGLRRLAVADGTVVDGRYWQRDRNAGRLFFAPTGRTLRQGEGYFGTSFLVLPFVAGGLTDHITVVVGAPLTLGRITPVYLAPKVRVLSVDGFDLAVGSLMILPDGDATDRMVGIAFAGGTIGAPDHALSVGLGWGFAGDEFASEPVAMVGGELRVSPKVKFITENHFLPDDDIGPVWSAGVRIIGDRLSADLGMATAEGECCLPLLNMTYAFGGR